MAKTADEPRPTLVYDGDCGFCSRCVDFLRRRGLDAEIVAWQQTDLDRYGLTEDEVVAAAQWVSPDGRVYAGHAAIARALRELGSGWSVLGRAVTAPGINPVARRSYAWIATNRYRLPGASGACAVQRPGSPAAR